ncbi:hypothetical protein [Mycobacterium sp. EPa45]|uniref:hypothetical protein n=1 Tax=Mycobacterium sp. EPa45 TaxID=1545728 RepID=UPI0006424875|nr:hypothetical protein [Mycobacterium sp. EPa45]AKK26594.1 hypothetical protein AB431_07685 [Mycobacterium sp. EPa45]
MAGTRYVGCLEGVVVPPRELVAQALDTITRAGPHTRLGLRPDPRALRWTWDAQAAPAIHELPADVADRGSHGVLDYINQRTGPRPPVEVYLSDRHMALDVDHGLGDAHLYVDCITTIFDVIQANSSSWLTEPDTPNPLLRALFHTFASPGGIRDAVAEARRRPITRAAPPATAPGSHSPAVEVIHVDQTVEREVDAWRAADSPSTSRAVTWLVIVHTALIQAGVPLSDTARLIVDGRRYLRPDDRVNANFIAGLRVHAPAGRNVRAIDADVRADLEAGLPLLAMASASALGLTAALRANRQNSVPSNATCQLGFSDLGRLVPFEKLPWSTDRPPSLHAGLQPWDPSDISAFSSTIGRERAVTLSYHGTVHDPHVVHEAAEAIRTDPIRLLGGS